MHFLGLAGMPRRVPDYPDVYSFWNSVATFGSYVTTFSLIVFLFVIYDAFINFSWSVNFLNIFKIRGANFGIFKDSPVALGLVSVLFNYVTVTRCNYKYLISNQSQPNYKNSGVLDLG